MVILDCNQVILSSLHAALGSHASGEIDLKSFRNMVANILKKMNRKFRREYGSLVLARDSKRYWRKEVFPYYKFRRKQDREKSKLNWTQIYECMDTVAEELQARYPYKYMCIPGAEADDIIGVLSREASEKVLIVSRDEDFYQLHRDNVRQYDTVNDKYLGCDNPDRFLFEHIVEGDYSDGIPNIKCPDDHYVMKRPKKMITKKFLEEIDGIEGRFDHEYFQNFQRNKKLIDLKQTPEALQQMIRDEFEKPIVGSRKDLRDYFMEKRMKDQLATINEF